MEAEVPAGQLVGETLGEVSIEELIGVGGMAEVYRGRDQTLGREVAVKVLSPTLHTQTSDVERFREEARRVAALDHTNIVSVYQFGEAHGSLYLVMPLLKESLRERLQREPVFPAGTAIKITVQIASALDAAHRQGLVHHDVKPENILLNADGKAFLTDFGIANQVAARLAAESAQAESAQAESAGDEADTQITPAIHIGTPSYMAPEQWLGGTLDRRIDIYSLGIVLYEMLTGVTPDDALQRSMDHMHMQQAARTPADIAPPSTYNPQVWPELDNAVMIALAYAPSDRYPDMRSFALALRGALLRHQLDAQGTTTTGNVSRGTQLSIPLHWLQSADTSFESDTDTTIPIPSNAGNTSDATRPLPPPFLPDIPLPAAKKATPARSKLLIATLLTLALLSLMLSSIALFASHQNGAIASFLGGAGTSVATNTAPNATLGTSGISATTTAEISSRGATPGATTGPGTPTVTQPAETPETTATTSPSATATSTPPPPQLQVGAVSLSHPGQSPHCTGSETIANTGTAAVSWSWQGFSNLPGDFAYTLNGGGSQSGLPHDASLAPNATDTIAIVQMTCSSGTTYQGSVQAQDVSDTLQSTSYPLSFTAP